MNTGWNFTIGGVSGPVATDMEQLTAMTNESGNIIFQSGQELAPFAYRGQTQEYPTCVPSMAREKRIEGRLLAACRNIAFQDVIYQHPYVVVTKDSVFSGKPLHVDVYGLAQHYGLATDMLDLTLNFDVASFFATCRLNDEGTSFIPMDKTDKPGVIYRVIFPLLDDLFPNQVTTVGWQPLPRPEQQRAVGIRMRTQDDFARWPQVQKINFRHSKEVSLRIWNLFSEGRALFPSDVAADMALKAKLLTIFTRSQVHRAWQMLEAFSPFTPHERNERQLIENEAGIGICKEPKLSWVEYDLESDPEILLNSLNKALHGVKYRRAMYSNTSQK